MIMILAIMMILPLFVCANLALWFFGVRPYIHRHGRACITAANWGLSLWADLTTAWEIGKKEGHIPLCAKALLALQALGVFAFVLSLI